MAKKKEARWTRFMDMHSGGGTKLWLDEHGKQASHFSWRAPPENIRPIEYVFIEAPQAEAETIFYNRFGRNPHRVTCTCCGSDYSIDDAETLEAATGYDRGCKYDSKTGQYIDEPDDGKWKRAYVALPEYLKRKDVLVIHATDIKPDERKGDVPQQGYVWCD